MSTSKKITLGTPIKVGGVQVNELTMRRPKVGDRLRADETEGSEARKEVFLFASLCEIAPSEIEDMDMADYTAMQKVFTSFVSSKVPVK